MSVVRKNTRTVPFSRITKQHRMLCPGIMEAINTVLDAGQFVGGQETECFEHAYSQYIRVPYCIGVNSGTDALILGVRALGIGPGDEVILPAHSFIATALGVSENGAKPVFVDIDSTGGMSIPDLMRKISIRTKAVIAVHLEGRPDVLQEMNSVIKKHKHILLIEDACQAHGAKYGGKRVGSIGIFGAFSFYPGKNLGAYGDAGAVVTHDARIWRFVRKLREYGQKKRYISECTGINSRLDSIQAAVLLTKLPHLDEWNEKRQNAAAIYTSSLLRFVSQIRVPLDCEERRSVYHLYCIRTPLRTALIQHLSHAGIDTRIHYPIPIHLQPAYRYLGYHRGDLPECEKRSKETLSLPMYPEISQKDILYVVRSIESFFQNLHNSVLSL